MRRTLFECGKLIMTSIGDYNKIISDRNIFNQIIYTSLPEALRLLKERQKDPELMAKVKKLLKGDIPEILKKKKCAVQFRQITTPNNECQQFIKLAKENDLQPVFFEYLDDKFTSNNEFKRSLGQIHIEDHVNKNNVFPVEKITIVDFAKYDGKKLRDVKTLWKEPLVDFHKKLFAAHDYNLKDFDFFDASEWLKNNGGNAVNYYTNFFLLFICFGILFENFLNSKNSEGEFTKNIILPALEKVINLTGVRPLIIPTDPIDMETDIHWISYHSKIKALVPKIKL